MTAFASDDASTSPKKSQRPSRALLLGGMGLIGLGALWLAAGQLFGHDNWWSIFILMPAVALLAAAGLAWQGSGGHYNLGVRLALLCGLPTLLVAGIFILRIPWDIGWTLMLMLMGGVVLLNGFTRPGLAIGSFGRGAADMLFWVGAAMLGLGLTFLLDRLGVINLQSTFGSARWWSIFILVPGVGALINAAVYRLKGQPAAAANQAALGLWICLYAAGHFAQVADRWLVPAMLIAAGVAVLMTRRTPAEQ